MNKRSQDLSTLTR